MLRGKYLIESMCIANASALIAYFSMATFAKEIVSVIDVTSADSKELAHFLGTRFLTVSLQWVNSAAVLAVLPIWYGLREEVGKVLE